MSTNLEIAKNIRIIETLKADILSDISGVYRGAAMGEDVGGEIAAAMAKLYLLAGRLGIGYNLIDMKMRRILKEEKASGNSLEQDYGDLTALERHLAASRVKNKLS